MGGIRWSYLFWSLASALLLRPPHALAQASTRSAMEARLDQCVAYYQRGDLTNAVGELREALRLRPEDPQVHFMLGNALYRSGDLPGAVRAYQEAIELRPNQFDAHMSRGFALFELGEFQNASAEWMSAMRLQSKDALAHAALAVGLFAAGQTEDAKLQYDMALASNSRYADPANLRIDIRWTPKALGVLQQLLETHNEPAFPLDAVPIAPRK